MIALFASLYSSFLLANAWKRHHTSTWILFFLAEIMLAVQGLAFFNALTTANLNFLSLIIIAATLVWHIYNHKRNRKDLISWEGAEKIKFSTGNLLFFLLIGLVAIFYLYTPLAETDSVSYHLPILTQILQTGGIWEVFQAGFVGPNTYFPANHETMQGFFMLITDNYQLNFLPTVLAFLLFASTLKNLGKQGSTYTALILVTVASAPFLFRQFLDFQIDLFLFSLFGASLCFLFLAIREKDHRYLFNFFLIFGLALGTKYNALMQGIFYLPLILWAIWVFRKKLATIWWYPLTTAATGGLWYLRNLIVAGNPIYPFGALGFEGHRRFLEDMQGTSFAAQDSLIDSLNHVLLTSQFNEQLGMMGLLTVSFAALILLAWTTLSLLQKKWQHALIGFSLIYLFTIQLIAYIHSPYTFTLWNETIRYTAALFALLPIIFILSANDSKLLKKLIYLLLTPILIISLLQSFLASSSHLLLIQYKWAFDPFTPLLILLCIALATFLLAATQKFKSRTIYPPIIILTISLFTFIISSQRIAYSKDDNRFLMAHLPGYDLIWPHLQTLREQPKGNLALAGANHYWLFEKEGFRPYYLHVDGCVDCTYPDYRKLENSVRSYPDEQKWLQLLQTKDIDYLLVGVNNYHSEGVELLEKSWAEANPKIFKPLRESGGLTLYQIQK